MTEPEKPVSPEPHINVRYDLAGNPLPSEPPHAPPPMSTSPLPFSPPSFTPPPGALPAGAAPAWDGPAIHHKKSGDGPALYVGLGIVALVLVALIFGLRARKPVIVAAPSSYHTYTALDNTFSCDAPAGWQMKETGSQGGSLSQVTFMQGAVRAHIVSDAEGSLMSDAMSSSNANLPPEQQKPPVEKLHEMDKPQLAESLTDYQENKASSFTSPVGDSRLSEWTATDGANKLHGYRVTMLGREREITVICTAPERNWALLKPAFQRIISSVKPGNG